MDVEPEQFHGHHNRFLETMQPSVQLHSMDIQPASTSEQRMEIVNQPPPFLQPPPNYSNRHVPLGFQVHHAPQVVLTQQQIQMPLIQMQQPQIQMPQPQQQSPSSSPETPKKTKKKKDKRGESPSNSPKGRGRYACLLHRQKHKRCPPDCPERKPKPSKSPVTSSKKTSPRKAKLLQSNQIELSGVSTELPLPGRPSRDASGVERPTWESAVTWEDLSWNELNPVQGWNAWDDLKSSFSTQWEESKKPVDGPKLQEFDPNSFLEEKLLQLSDSPEGGGAMSDVRMTEL